MDCGYRASCLVFLWHPSGFGINRINGNQSLLLIMKNQKRETGEGEVTIVHGLDMGKQEPKPDIEGWLDAVAHQARNLTKWEEGFIESISDQWGRSGFLSERQIEILERIYAEKVP